MHREDGAMTKEDEVVFAIGLDNIWVSPNGRPFWTYHNVAGNAGPHLTDKELDRRGLFEFKRFPFSELWAECHKADHEKTLTKRQYIHSTLPKNYVPYESTLWDDEKEKRYQSGLRAIRKMIEKYKR